MVEKCKKVTPTSAQRLRVGFRSEDEGVEIKSGKSIQQVLGGEFSSLLDLFTLLNQITTKWRIMENHVSKLITDHNRRLLTLTTSSFLFSQCKLV